MRHNTSVHIGSERCMDLTMHISNAVTSTFDRLRLCYCERCSVTLSIAVSDAFLAGLSLNELQKGVELAFKAVQ